MYSQVLPRKGRELLRVCTPEQQEFLVFCLSYHLTTTNKTCMAKTKEAKKY